MRHHIVFCLTAFTGLKLLAQTPDLSGTWVADSSASQKWVLTQKDGQLHVQEMNGNKKEADFTCPLNGQECSVKEDGRSEKISMYFNGSKLVELRERGSTTIKQRLAISSDGKTLTVETVPLSSSDKVETNSFRRQDL